MTTKEKLAIDLVNAGYAEFTSRIMAEGLLKDFRSSGNLTKSFNIGEKSITITKRGTNLYYKVNV